MTHETADADKPDDADEPNALPGEFRVPRRALMWFGVALGFGVLVIAAGLAVAGYSAITSDAFVDGLGYSSDSTDLDVSYVAAGGCDQMVRVRASETDDAVVLDLVSWKLPFVPDAPRSIDCLVTFHLSQPLGDREVRMANGEEIIRP